MGWQHHDENGNLRVEADDDARVIREYDEDGNVTAERPYSDEDNAVLDAAIAFEEREKNRAELLAGLNDVLAKALERQAEFQGIRDTLNADIRNNPAPAIQTLAKTGKQQERAIMALARLVGDLLDSTDTGTD